MSDLDLDFAMPQPLRSWTPMVFANTSLNDRPELGIYIGRIAAIWSDIEVNMGLLLADILNTEARTGVAMYLALSGSAAQDKTLIAAADICVPEMSGEVSDLTIEVRRRAAERNRVVHALWAAPFLLPDILVNCPPDNIIQHVATSYKEHSDPNAVFKTQPNPSFVEKLRSYKKQDFEDIIQRVLILRQKISVLGDQVRAFQRAKAALASAQEQTPRTRQR